MFGWLKDKLTGGSKASAVEELRAEFKDLEQLPGAPAGLADRLARFILTGEGPGILSTLPKLKNIQTGPAIIFTTADLGQPSGLAKLITHLPQDPEILLRLAKVYDTLRHAAGVGVAFSFGAPVIPAFDGSFSWLRTFLTEISVNGQQKDRIFPAGLVVAMIEVSGSDPGVLRRGPFFFEDAQGKTQLNSWTRAPSTVFQCLDQFSEFVLSSPDEIRPAFRQREAHSRAGVLEALAALQISPEPFAEEVAALAVAGSKEVRESAVPLISQQFLLFKELLERHAEQSSADERFNAVRLLARLGGDGEREFLSQRLEKEKSEKIRELLRDTLALATTQATLAIEQYDFPEIPEVPVRAPLDKKCLAILREQILGVESATAIQFANNKFAKQQGWTRTPVTPEAADRLLEALQNYVVKDPDLREFFGNSYGVTDSLLHLPIPSEFQLIHVIRWCLLLAKHAAGVSGKLDRWQLGFHWHNPLQSYQKIQNKTIDLRELAAVFRTIGLDEGDIGRTVLQRNEYTISFFPEAEPEKCWPYFAERIYLLEEALGSRASQEYFGESQRQHAFRLLQLFPQVPQRLIQPIWEVALGGNKSDRDPAQACLENFPNKEEKIVAALASRQQDTRSAAAQWLGALGYKDAIPALRTALAKEKSEVVKDEFIKSLELMGVPLDELLDLDRLDEEAEKGLKKGIPKDLDWFPVSELPTVVWADSGKPVPTAIVHWFILQGYKLKTAEASPALRRYCSLFRKEDRERLGRFVLEAWIAQDTKPKYTADQASAEAQRVARQTAAYAKQAPQYYPDFDEQRVYQTNFNWLIVQPEGSQNSTKGILAVAGACCGGDVAPTVHRYVKQWYGMRAAQCKALLQVLAWVDHPNATQVVLSVANRFRTKGIQEEAMRLCELLADRKGWTMDELSDRTIPTAGLDEAGTMELDYGTRKFIVTLSEDMSIALTNENAKTIASLPDGNQSDDPEKVKQAKAAVSSARKELKSVLSMQRDRLYEALCTQRTWRFEDWDTYLRQHPIVGRYCQRLVWVAYDDERVVESFRPLPDGTLTNRQDDEVKLTEDTPIRLGHDETLADDDRTAWLQHFSDYEVEPLFQQFGKQQFTLTDDMKDKTDIRDFLGHIVKAFSLRTRLTRLGYTRGAAEDGGWFLEYRKTFLSLGMEAVIEFTGNSLPEENRTVALQRLYFTRRLGHGTMVMSRELPLGKLPRVLLAECWNDIRIAAADGPGFAADWEKQTEV